MASRVAFGLHQPAPGGAARPMTDQYFSPTPGAAHRPRRVTLALPDLTIALATDAATFSPDRVDAGTRLLLLEAPPIDEATTVLDLGCGYGPMAVTAARRASRATVWAVDTNERAVELCRANAEANEVGDRVHALAVPADEPLAGIPDDVRFEVIWSNPPIRVGKAVLHALLRAGLGRLAPDGHAVLVVHKHLGSDSLQRWLVDQGFPTERLVSRQGYRLLRVLPRTEASP